MTATGAFFFVLPVLATSLSVNRSLSTNSTASLSAALVNSTTLAEAELQYLQLTSSSFRMLSLKEQSKTWTAMGEKLGKLKWDKVEWVKDADTKSLKVFGVGLSSTLKFIGAIEAGVDGDMDSMIKGLGSTAVVLTGLIPGVGPAISLALGIFMSLFDVFGGEQKDSLGEALKELREEIMKDVKGMISTNRVDEAVIDAQSKLAVMVGKLAETNVQLSPLSNAMSPERLRLQRFGFWRSIHSSMQDSLPYVFGLHARCVSSDGKTPAANASSDELCQKFHYRGVITSQMPFALMHINVLGQMAALADCKYTRALWLEEVRKWAGVYSKLLSSSLDIFLTYPEEECSWSYPEYWGSGCWARPGNYKFCHSGMYNRYSTNSCWCHSNPQKPEECGCTPSPATLNNNIHKHSGRNMATEMQCSSSVTLTVNNAPRSPPRDLCKSKFWTGSDYACTQKDYSIFTEQHKAYVKTQIGEKIAMITKLSKPLNMDKAVETLVKIGKTLEKPKNDINEAASQQEEKEQQRLKSALADRANSVCSDQAEASEKLCKYLFKKSIMASKLPLTFAECAALPGPAGLMGFLSQRFASIKPIFCAKAFPKGTGVFPPYSPPKYFKFTPLSVRDDGKCVQISEIAFRTGDTDLTMMIEAENPEGDNPSGEGANKAIDGNTATKWLDCNKGPLLVTLASATDATEFSFTTANDHDERDPVSWRLETSDDASSWKTVQDEPKFSTPSERFARTQWFSLKTRASIMNLISEEEQGESVGGKSRRLGMDNMSSVEFFFRV